MASCSGESKRRRLNHDQKEHFRTLIREDGSKRNLSSLVSDWNSRVSEHNCPINIRCLKRLQTEMPNSPESTWEKIKSEVAVEIARPNAWKEYEPRTGGFDYDGCMTTGVDASKIPFAELYQMDSIEFDFDKHKMNASSGDKQKQASNEGDKFKADFRKHFSKKGMMHGSFNNFFSQNQRDADPTCLGEGCVPSTTNGPWKTLADVVTSDKQFQRKCNVGGAVFGATFDSRQERINPNFDQLREHYIEKEKKAETGVAAALLHVLRVCEALFRSVSSWLPTCERKDSLTKKYAIPQDLTPSYFSLLSCLAPTTTTQIEHMDDHCSGASALWGLVPDQYVIVWWNSYEMNRELEELSSAFYEFVMKQPRPDEWTELAFWNLVAGLCLKAKGFDSWRKPTPVKIPLEVGKLLLMDYMVVHAGMPFVAGRASLRGHLYWAQTAARDGETASGATCPPWATYHKLYPSWRILSKDRRQFQ